MDDLDFNKRLAEEMRALGYSDAALFAKEAMRAVFRLADARYQRADVTPAASKPVLGEWREPDEPGGAWYRCANGNPDHVAVTADDDDCAEFGWTVYVADSTKQLARGLAPDLASAKRAADEAAREWYTLPEDAKPPAIEDATEEAIGIVARANSVTDEFVRSGIDKYPSGVFGHLVREIAAALRRRSGMRIGTVESKAIDIVRRLARVGGCALPVGIIFDAGSDLVYDARALVALMARDGEGSR